MAIPIIPIIMAVTALASGVTKAVTGVKNAKSEAKLAKQQAEENIQERARQAVKLMNQQKTSFLKSGVFFEGTPEAILNETYNFMKTDTDRLKNNANINIKNIMRQGKTAFATSLLDSVTGALSGFSRGLDISGGGTDNSGGGADNSGGSAGSEFTGNSEGFMDKMRNIFGRKTNLVGGFGPVDGTNYKSV